MFIKGLNRIITLFNPKINIVLKVKLKVLKNKAFITSNNKIKV
jgi:hypothetical protein